MSQFSNLSRNNLSNQPETPSITSSVFSTHVVDEVTRTAYLRLYSKHADVVKNNLSKVSDDVDTLYSSILSGFASFEIDTGDNGDLGGGGGGLGDGGGGFGAGG